jgi:hypothetical protein
MLRDTDGFKGAVVELTKGSDYGVNVFEFHELLGATKGVGDVKEYLNPVSCGAGQGKRGVFDKKMNHCIKVLFST